MFHESESNTRYNNLEATMKRKTFFQVLLILVTFVLLLQVPGLLKPFVRRMPTEEAQTHAKVRKESRNTYPAGMKEDLRVYDVITSSTNVMRKQDVTFESNAMGRHKEGPEYEVKDATPKTQEITHISFLKVHKAASTTVQGIIQRFGLKRNLSFVIASPTHYISKQKAYFSDLWPPLPKSTNSIQNTTNCDKSSKYDILCNHMVFNHKKVSRLLHSDTKYIAIVRHPHEHFLSAAFYYKFVWKYPYLEKLSNETFISDLIRNTSQNEATTMAESMTYNSMAYDFGLAFSTLREAEKISEKKFNEFLNKTGDIFHLVMLVEKFDESLVLMKRYLNWSLEDLIYIKINTYLSESKTKTLKALKITGKDTNILRKRNKFDYALYNFFKDRLEKQMSKEVNFRKEVKHFKNILRDVQEFCEDEEEQKIETTLTSLKSEKNGKKINEQNTERKDENEWEVKKNEVHKDSAVIKHVEELNDSNAINQDNQKNSTNALKQGNNALLGEESENQTKNLSSVINSTIDKKKMTQDQEVEIRKLANFRDRWTVKDLSKVLPLLFYDKDKSAVRESELLIPKSKWNKDIFVTTSDCELITMDELERYEIVKEKHLKHLVRRKFGDNFSVKDALKYVYTFY